MKEFIVANLAAVVFAGTAVLGSLLHWAKKAYRGEATWNPMEYWLADHPGNSAGAVGALVTAVWGVIFSDSLAGMQMHMIVAGGFTLGWMLDSGINKASGGVGQDEKPVSKQGGFALPQMLVAVAIAAAASVMLSGCGLMETKPVQSVDAKAACVKVESAAVCEARAYLQEGYAALIGLNGTIQANADARVWSKSQAQGYLDKSREARGKLDKASDYLKLGDLVNVKSQVELYKTLLTELQRAVAAQARK